VPQETVSPYDSNNSADDAFTQELALVVAFIATCSAVYLHYTRPQDEK